MSVRVRLVCGVCVWRHLEMSPDLEVRESGRKRPLPFSWQVLGQQWLVASTGDKEGPRMSDLALQEEKD